MPQRDRVTARDIVQDIVANMRQSLEPMMYRTLAPGRYEVVLNGEDFDRLEKVIPAIRRDAARALDEAIRGMNSVSLKRRVLSRVTGPQVPVEGTASWNIELIRDLEGSLEPGVTAVTSSLDLPESPDYGSGNPTVRVTTVRHGDTVETSRRRLSARADDNALVHGVLSYEDSLGKRRYLITKDLLRVGRGGLSPEVDVRIETPLLDISREHFRLRRDHGSGRFFIADLSRHGTTIDGVALPPPADAGARGAGAAEVPIDRVTVRIGLADVMFMELDLAGKT